MVFLILIWARNIAKFGEFAFLMPNNLHSISTIEYPTPARRPGYSILDSHKYLEVFGISPSNWEIGISNVLRKLQMY